uniref:COP9 signalosome complex subunit 8 n=1 Tax=Amblyomma maculatum TaxID=34609 RepID=G3MRD5_AMBMU
MAVGFDGSGDARMQEYKKLAADLEQQELQASNGIANPQTYSQLLAIYLLQSDLVNAKLLWKRIPREIKLYHPEIRNIWKVGQAIWNKDFPAMHASLTQEWPEHVKFVMQELRVRMKRRALTLVTKAYSSISVDHACSLMGIDKPELAAVVNSLGWAFDGTRAMVFPKPPAATNEDPSTAEEHLSKLTNFSSFLEN